MLKMPTTIAIINSDNLKILPELLPFIILEESTPNKRRLLLFGEISNRLTKPTRLSMMPSLPSTMLSKNLPMTENSRNLSMHSLKKTEQMNPRLTLRKKLLVT